jgi:hypothetical protein
MCRGVAVSAVIFLVLVNGLPPASDSSGRQTSQSGPGVFG